MKWRRITQNDHRAILVSSCIPRPFNEASGNYSENSLRSDEQPLSDDEQSLIRDKYSLEEEEHSSDNYEQSSSDHEYPEDHEDTLDEDRRSLNNNKTEDQNIRQEYQNVDQNFGEAANHRKHIFCAIYIGKLVYPQNLSTSEMPPALLDYDREVSLRDMLDFYQPCNIDSIREILDAREVKEAAMENKSTDELDIVATKTTPEDLIAEHIKDATEPAQNSKILQSHEIFSSLPFWLIPLSIGNYSHLRKETKRR